MTSGIGKAGEGTKCHWLTPTWLQRTDLKLTTYGVNRHTAIVALNRKRWKEQKSSPFDPPVMIRQWRRLYWLPSSRSKISKMQRKTHKMQKDCFKKQKRNENTAFLLPLRKQNGPCFWTLPDIRNASLHVVPLVPEVKRSLKSKRSQMTISVHITFCLNPCLLAKKNIYYIKFCKLHMILVRGPHISIYNVVSECTSISSSLSPLGSFDFRPKTMTTSQRRVRW